MIIGGSGKGEDYSILNQHIQKKCKKIYLIGASTDEMYNTFSNIDVKIEKHSSFKTSIKSAYENANSGEIVLLSPACASYDMFKNFEDRGNQFKQVVSEIKNAQ